ncbi:MFS transporter [Paraburkholderia silvatlantica]|uniref:MFS family permease n=1 Tax=Paraburkholderia silvatlantica TaxID=321895 RepID=A0ABR6FEI4_9BURK|nr:MFS transporter [Paraburkholderia silvatlantica]MBB2925846.1 MFS family permease [Paraburkholderia silvatlantica]PVY33385.1 putative MFS family arabinose efflux permease [Paraburkholderia silvatlantica]PXW38325.1 putative MFS family arabinose efflux permease [Paraburkholderia silvatlantica]TDQ92777.1 putative MFS family arabinose efflux permease [Paraburkholderia silvatlantica]
MNDATLSATAPIAPPAATRQSQFRLIAACSIGNALEMYDFTVYSFFALLIGRLFFPSDSPYGSLLLAVATFGIGFVMRPLGGLVIGSYADRRGRKAAMTLTIALMVAGTLCISLAPTYAQAGVIGSLVILAGRLLQGFSLGGEIGASTAMLMESGEVGQRGFRVSWQLGSQGISALVGALTGAVLYATLSPQALESWGWRLPFLGGLLIAPVGLYIRSRLDETHEAEPDAPSPLATLMREHGAKVGLGILSITAGTVGMYLVVFFMPTYMIRVLRMPPSLSLLSGCATGFTMLVASLVSGRLADRLARRKRLVLGALLFNIVAIVPAFWLMTRMPSVPLVLALSVMITAAANLGSTPMLLMLMEMLPASVRASGLSVIYSVGVTVFGGSSQFVVTWLLAKTGNPLSPAVYLVVCGLISLCAIGAIRERRVG